MAPAWCLFGSFLHNPSFHQLRSCTTLCFMSFGLIVHFSFQSVYKEHVESIHFSFHLLTTRLSFCSSPLNHWTLPILYHRYSILSKMKFLSIFCLLFLGIVVSAASLPEALASPGGGDCPSCSKPDPSHVTCPNKSNKNVCCGSKGHESDYQTVCCDKSGNNCAYVKASTSDKGARNCAKYNNCYCCKVRIRT